MRTSGPTGLVGVLALQGDFAAHVAALERRGMAVRLVRRPRDLEGLDGITLPGGESSTMLRLMRFAELQHPLERAVREGLPTLATCAGMILLAREVRDPAQDSLDVLDITVSRNGYGRQLHSATHALRGHSGFPDCKGIFIRAPRVMRTGESCEVLATRDGDAVLVRSDKILAASFHPELEESHPAHGLFVEAVENQRRSRRESNEGADLKAAEN